MTRWCDHRIVFRLDRDLDGSDIVITFCQNGKTVIEYGVGNERVSVAGNVVTLDMTPEDTALFSCPFTLAQINLLTGDKRQATELMRIPVTDNLCGHTLGIANGYQRLGVDL